MKPDRTHAMQKLITTVREKMPFDEVDANICTGQCNTCSIKLLEYLDTELETWEYGLKNGDIPDFGDINKLAKSSNKIFKILVKNNLVDKD